MGPAGCVVKGICWGALPLPAAPPGRHAHTSGTPTHSACQHTLHSHTCAGDRACVDLACLMQPGEGMLVGSLAAGLFLVSGSMSMDTCVGRLSHFSCMHAYTWRWSWCLKASGCGGMSYNCDWAMVWVWPLGGLPAGLSLC